MTRARAGVYRGVEAFGARSRAFVHWDMSEWCAHHAGSYRGERFDTWAEALAYALGKDE